MKKLTLIFIGIMMYFMHSSAANTQNLIDNVVYNEDKSITVYATVKSEFDEIGISINFDEKAMDFSDSIKFKAYEKTDVDGRYGIIIPYSEFAHDGVFALKSYVISSGVITYSENVIVADAERQYSRVPLLKSAVPSEGEIYPQLSSEVTEYYVLVDKIPANPLSIKYETDDSKDSVSYTEAFSVSDSVKIRISSGYKENTYTFTYRLRKKAQLIPAKYFVKDYGKSFVASNGLISGSRTSNYITLDASGIPEKYIPTKVMCNIKGTAGKNASIAPCTEPFIDTKSWESVSTSYSPQTGEWKKFLLSSTGNSIIMNEKDFSTRSSLKLAIQAEEGAVLSEFAVNLEYFEDVALISTDKFSNEPKAISVSVGGANEIYPAFDPNVYEYYAVYDSIPDSVPTVSFVAENPAADVKVTPAADVNGETIAEITLNGKTNIYKVRFRQFREAAMKLKAAAAKRSPYEFFTLKFPQASTTPYNSYMGRIENEYGTSHSHLAAMAFDTSAVKTTNIHISTAELILFATTNCEAGIYIDLYRSTKTSWVSGSSGRNFYATANHFAPRGAEGKLNSDVLIKHTGGKTEPEDFRYYTIPLNTVGFTSASSINLYILSRWQTVNPPDSTYQNAYIWTGKNSSETCNGVGMYPTVYIKYFEK